MRRDRAAILLAAALVALPACGGGSGGGGTGGGGGGGDASGLPECAGADQTIERPAALPQDFPLPEGTVFVEERESEGFTIVEARVPGDLAQVKQQWDTELEQAGFLLTGGESGADKATTEFQTIGLNGQLTLQTIPGCEGALSLEVAVR
jgi:hypothetical protein